jgi:hypothetical protein
MWTTVIALSCASKRSNVRANISVNCEIVRHTLYVNVEANSKNIAARIVQDIAESKLGIGKCEEIVIVQVEQYFSRQPKSVFEICIA